MYVRDAARGQGVADAILARIEAEVRHAGLSVLRLETGTRQIAAMRFYARIGFRECRGIRRLCAEAGASDCEQCVLRETGWNVAPDCVAISSRPRGRLL